MINQKKEGKLDFSCDEGKEMKNLALELIKRKIVEN